MKTITINNPDLEIKILTSDEIKKIVDDVGYLGNTNFCHYDFEDCYMDNEKLKLVCIYNKNTKEIITHLGKWGELDWSYLPKCDGRNVSVLVFDTKDGIAELAELVGTFAHPDEISWYKINNQLICELYYS